jgi:hypothetical protein
MESGTSPLYLGSVRQSQVLEGLNDQPTEGVRIQQITIFAVYQWTMPLTNVQLIVLLDNQQNVRMESFASSMCGHAM